MHLRPYQHTFIQQLRESLHKKQRIIGCMATGAGKTVVFLSIAQSAIAKGSTVLIITESTKIYHQIKKQVGKCHYIAEGVKSVYVESGCIYVAMAQTLQRRPKIIDQFNALGSRLLIMNDEAHVGTSTKVLKQLPSAYLIGFTASPDYRVAKHLPELYNDTVIGSQPQELIESGFLCPYNHYERKPADLAGLVKSSTGDYTEASQEFVFETKRVYDGLLDDLGRTKFYKGVIFTASIKHCRDTVAQLRSAGYNVSEVHSKNPQSEFELFQFTHGINSLVVSVGSMTKGWDFPPTDLVVLLRATSSLALYLQMCGRGSRISVDTAKTHFNVLDYGGNGSRFGLWNYTHDWAELWRGKPRKSKDGVAPVKDCPQCGYLMPTVQMTCPGCGHVFVKPPPTPEETALVELTAAYNALRGRQISTLTARELSIYAKTTNKRTFAIRIARQKGDLYLNEFGKLMGYKSNWGQVIGADKTLNYADIIIK